MLRRTSYSNHINVDTVSFSSVFQIGDSSSIQAFSKALAVQRESEIFFGNEGEFIFPVYREEIPIPPITEPVKMSVQNRNPFIKVNNINIIGISSASVLQVGSNEQIQLETRVKHIRQLQDRT